MGTNGARRTPRAGVGTAATSVVPGLFLESCRMLVASVRLAPICSTAFLPRKWAKTLIRPPRKNLRTLHDRMAFLGLCFKFSFSGISPPTTMDFALLSYSPLFLFVKLSAFLAGDRCITLLVWIDALWVDIRGALSAPPACLPGIDRRCAFLNIPGRFVHTLSSTPPPPPPSPLSPQVCAQSHDGQDS